MRSVVENVRQVAKLPSSLDDSAVVQEIPATLNGGKDVPHFPDFADPGGDESNAFDEIPATYGGAILVGSISLSLVIVCLVLAMWYHYTSPRFESPLHQSRKCLISSSPALHSVVGHPTSQPLGDKNTENVHLDIFMSAQQLTFLQS
jgi:hypothetical protein